MLPFSTAASSPPKPASFLAPRFGKPFTNPSLVDYKACPGCRYTCAPRAGTKTLSHDDLQGGMNHEMRIKDGILPFANSGVADCIGLSCVSCICPESET